MAVKFLEANKGFLSLNGKQVMQLMDITVTYSTATEETASFDNQFIKSFQPTWTSWTADATFIADDTTAGYYTGTTSNPTGSTNGLLMFESIKLRTAMNLVVKIDAGNFQKGSVIVTSCDIKAQAGKFLTGSIKMQGSGALTKATT